MADKFGVKKHEKSVFKMRLDPKITHFAAFETAAEWDAGLSVRQLSKESLETLKKIMIISSEIGIVFFILYFISLICFKEILKLELILNTSVMVMLIGYWSNYQ